MHLALANHLRERQPEFGRAHRARQGHEHHAAVVQVPFVGVGGVDERGGIEVAVVVVNENANCGHRCDSVRVMSGGNPLFKHRNLVREAMEPTRAD